MINVAYEVRRHSDLVTFDLPPGVLSLAGMPRSFDSAEKPFETYILGDRFGTVEDAELGYGTLASEFVTRFLKQLPPGIVGVEWRAQPTYEVFPDDDDKSKWVGKVRCRYSAHTELPA